MAELRSQLPAIRRAGADVAIVGTGSPSEAKAIQKELQIPDVRIFSDPKGMAYERAGLRRGILPLLRPRAVGNYLRAFFSGYVPRKVQGDSLQQGGVLVVRPGGTVAYAFRSRVAGDAPPLGEILGVLQTSKDSGAE